MTTDPNHTSSQTRHASAGFSLIEMLTVTTVIGILAGISVPTYTARRIAANETAVVATLRAVAQAQFQFKAMGAVDTNGDSGAEYGTLPELAALEPLRGTTETLTKRLLTATLGALDANGHATHKGFHFCLYLPQATGEGIPGSSASAGMLDPYKARDYWTCLAWPRGRGSTGNHTFFVNQQGEVLRTRKPVYDGKSKIPPAGAGLTGVAATHIDSQELAVNRVGADGEFWVTVN